MRWARLCESIEAGPIPSPPPPFSDPFRGRNPVCRELVMMPSLELANRFVSNAIALPGGGGPFLLLSAANSEKRGEAVTLAERAPSIVIRPARATPPGPAPGEP